MENAETARKSCTEMITKAVLCYRKSAILNFI